MSRSLGSCSQPHRQVGLGAASTMARRLEVGNGSECSDDAAVDGSIQATGAKVTVGRTRCADDGGGAATIRGPERGSAAASGGALGGDCSRAAVKPLEPGALEFPTGSGSGWAGAAGGDGELLQWLRDEVRLHDSILAQVVPALGAAGAFTVDDLVDFAELPDDFEACLGRGPG